MNIRNIYFITLSVLGSAFVSCSDSDSSSIDYSGYTDAYVTSFSLPDNSTYAESLSELHFSIDQYGDKDSEGNLVGRIYNADSLPVGTDVGSLLATIEANSPKSIMLHITTTSEDDEETTEEVEYSSTDSINFTKPIMMEITAADGVTKKWYEVKVNVHSTFGDSLHWQSYMTNALPVASSIESQKAVAFGNGVNWYVETGAGYALYTASDNSLNQWSKAQDPDFGGLTPALRSVKSFDGSLYVATAEGTMMVSADGSNWNQTAQSTVVKNLVGVVDAADGYASRLLAIVEQDGKLYHAYTNDGSSFRIEQQLSSQFPVDGFSDALQYYRIDQNLVIAGGQLQDGTLSASCWAYNMEDSQWGEFKKQFSARKGASMIAYQHDPRYSNTLWLLVGGENADGSFNDEVWYSRDYGVSWFKPANSLTFPEDHVANGFASVYVDSNFYINLIGGVDESGELNQIWRGRLNMLAFTPVE